MPKRAIVFLLFSAAVALSLGLPTAAFARDEDPPTRTHQWGEERWVPSLAISGGAIFQDMKGNVDSVQFEGGSPDPLPLQGYHEGDDLLVVPFVGASLEIMTPAFDIPTRPRIFLSGEILPSFSSTRSLAVAGDPGCIRGPEPGSPCATEETPGARDQGFGEEAANGQGSKTNAEVDTLAYGANLGVAFPVQIGKRQVRVKPSFSWISYEVDAEGVVSDAACAPVSRCTDITIFGFVVPGELRMPSALEGGTSRRFNGIGPGLDIEMDAVRWGPLGASLFLGARAYYIVGNREISFDASHTYTDPGPFENDVTAANWNVEVDKWLFRAHVGLRIHWLGGAK